MPTLPVPHPALPTFPGLPAVPVLSALPPLWREGRPLLEARSLVRDPVWRGEGVPHGDGAPVLLVCGFLAGDRSLRMMGAWLKAIGYEPARAGIRWNVGCGGGITDRLETIAERLAEERGRPVAIVGQSRGGTFAHALALQRPDLVDRVVALGSPLNDHLDVHPLIWMQAHALGALGTLGVPGLVSNGCRHGDCCAELNAAMHAPATEDVPLTSVYSRSDGIVRWRSCLKPGAEHVEVDASHIGMAVHPEVYRAVASALAQPPARRMAQAA